MKKTKLAEKLIENKGTAEGTKEWLRAQLRMRSTEGELGDDDEEKEAQRAKKRQLLDKLRGLGQGEKREPGKQMFGL